MKSLNNVQILKEKICYNKQLYIQILQDIYKTKQNKIGDKMIDYNYEYQFEGEYSKYKTSNKYRIPIKSNINNSKYKQQQLEFIRNLFPKGLNKQFN